MLSSPEWCAIADSDIMIIMITITGEVDFITDVVIVCATVPVLSSMMK
jgi:hypothetical protein